MKGKWTYLIQTVGIVIAAIGVVIKFDRQLAGCLVFGALIFSVGWFLRRRNLL